MRVAHFVQGYTPAIGGTEYLIQRVSEELANNFGDEVTVYTTNAFNCEAFTDPRVKVMPAGEEVINNVTVKRYPVFNRLAPILNVAQKIGFRFRLPRNDLLRTVYGGPLMPSLSRDLGRVEADVVAASSFPLMHMYYAGRAARRAGAALVLHGGLHPDDAWGFDRRVIYRAIAKADAYIANTTFERDYLLGRGIDPKKIHVVGVGTDPEKFTGVDATVVRERQGWQDDPVITFVGQEGGHKGIETLLKAMPLVWRQLPEAKLMIAGSRTAFSPVFDALIDDFSPSERQRVARISNFAQEEKAEIIAAADVFASPSGFESFGITYLEAWAAGKPVIGCRSGAVPSVISDGQDGVLVDYKDQRELAGALLELLLDAGLRKQLAANGRQKVLENYTWKKIGERFRDIYGKVIA